MIKTKTKSEKKTEKGKADKALTIFDSDSKTIDPRLKLVGQMAIAQYLKRFMDTNAENNSSL